jgi:hypothetical protein
MVNLKPTIIVVAILLLCCIAIEIFDILRDVGVRRSRMYRWSDPRDWQKQFHDLMKNVRKS